MSVKDIERGRFKREAAFLKCSHLWTKTFFEVTDGLKYMKGFITLYIQLNLIFDPSSEYLDWAYSYFTPPPLIFFLVPFLHISFSIVCYKDKEHLTIQFIFTATLWRGPRGKEIEGLLLLSNPVSDLPSTRLMVTGYWPVLVLSIMPHTSTSLTLLNSNRICCTLPVFWIHIFPLNIKLLKFFYLTRHSEENFVLFFLKS